MPVVSNDAITINNIVLTDQGSTPTTPASGKTRVYSRSTGLFVVDDAGTVTGPLASAVTVTNDYILVTDQKNQNTAGGTFTAGDWRTRDLNTEVSDAGGCVTVASNQITVGITGTYRFNIRAPAYACNAHQLKLYDVTGAADVAVGMSSYANSSNNGWSVAQVCGTATLTSGHVYEVRHRCTTSSSTSGFGVVCNYGPETYTIVEMWRVG